METICDKHGRRVQNGDLIKVFHFVDARTRRIVYMYKLVLEDDYGLSAVDVVDIGVHKSLDKAFTCRLSVVDDEFEIIDNAGYKVCFWERKRKKV